MKTRQILLIGFLAIAVASSFEASLAQTDSTELPLDAGAAKCPPCNGGFQSLPSNGEAVDLALWMKHNYTDSGTSHLTQSSSGGNNGYWDYHLVDGGKTLLFSKSVETSTRIVRNLEQFHIGERWVNIDFEWVDSKANGGVTTYRKFTRRDGGPYVGRWARRNTRTGESFQIEVPFRNCPDGARHLFVATNTIRGPVHAPYTTCILDVRTGVSKPTKALVLESVSGDPNGAMYREWYWYAKSEDGLATYGLIRWDFYERSGPKAEWVLKGGGCQMNKIVAGDACLPWDVINSVNGRKGCSQLPAPSCP